MKTQLTRKFSVMLLCLVLVFAMLLSACQQPTTPPDPDDEQTPGDTDKDPGDTDKDPDDNDDNDNDNNDDDNKEDPPVDDGFVKLTEKGNLLYDATYQTMIDRLNQDGYAQTSITGAYPGMFVRDASIQVMAHIAQGDMDAAMRILKYMAAYHKEIGAAHAIHIMNSLNDDYLYDSVVGEKVLAAISNGANGQSVTQMGHDTALFKIVLPNNQAAQTFSVPFDTITEIAISLEVSATAGTLHLLIGNEAGDNSVADLDFDISKITVVLTAEASGIALATVCAQKFGVPMLFAKKAKSDNIEGGLYQSEVFSYTYKKKFTMIVSNEWLSKDDHVLIIDDFMAKGYAMQGLIDLVNEAGATLEGIGVAVEKGFQGGGDRFRAGSVPYKALAVIEQADENGILFREED